MSLNGIQSNGGRHSDLELALFENEKPATVWCYDNVLGPHSSYHSTSHRLETHSPEQMDHSLAPCCRFGAMQISHSHCTSQISLDAQSSMKSPYMTFHCFGEVFADVSYLS